MTNNCNKLMLLSLTICLSGVFLHYFMYMNLLNFDLMKYLNDYGNTGQPLYDSKQLSQYNGNGPDKKIYISILGLVFDVTEGMKHYGPGAPYHAFTGRDASRAFVTGNFDEDKVLDAVLDLSTQELRSLNDWRKFYNKTYKFKGKLIGRYFDKNGASTWYLQQLEKRIKDAEKEELEKAYQKVVYPPCNVAWDSERGTKVWCTNRSGGIERSWVGVPRKLYEPGSKHHRCACISKELILQSNLEEYDQCPSESSSCYVKQ